MLFTKFRFDELPWKLLSVEALLVVASVLLALALDSWREEREQHATASRALQGFVDEAESNCRQIAGARSYHAAVLAGEREPQGMVIGLLRNDAWEVVKTTGAAAWLDYDVVAAMSEISARQADHRTIFQAYLEAVFSQVLAQSGTVEWHRPGERGVIRELVRIQDDLRERYRRLAELATGRLDKPATGDGLCLSTLPSSAT